MEPQQLAALLGTEVDTGFAAALSRLGASGALVVDTIRTRVGAVPNETTDQVDWSTIPWLADVTMTPRSPLPASVATDPDLPDDPADVRGHLAALPVSAIRGVGTAWATRLRSWGISQIGDLADADPSALMDRAERRRPALVVLIARARRALAPWPLDLPAGNGRSLAALATSRPERGDVSGFILREHCMGLLAVLDLDVAGEVSVP